MTPAHDFNDFEVGRRHNLPQINVLDALGKIISRPGDQQPLIYPVEAIQSGGRAS